MRVYKLTDENGQTHGNTQWGENVTHKAKGKGKGFCSEDYIHCYSHPLLAVMLNPIHADFHNPRLWEAEAGKVDNDHGLKLGTKKLTTLKEIPLPVITTEQRVKFAILCVKQVYKDTSWNAWADKWLSGKRVDRVARVAAAAGAASVAEVAAEAASWAAEVAAEAASWAAEVAAEAASWAARAARVARAAEAASWAAEVAAEAASWVARAAGAAEAAAGAAFLDLIALAEEAVK